MLIVVKIVTRNSKAWAKCYFSLFLELWMHVMNIKAIVTSSLLLFTKQSFVSNRNFATHKCNFLVIFFSYSNKIESSLKVPHKNWIESNQLGWSRALHLTLIFNWNFRLSCIYKWDRFCFCLRVIFIANFSTLDLATFSIHGSGLTQSSCGCLKRWVGESETYNS